MNGAECDAAMGATLSSENDLPPRDRWARLRFAIVGPLLAAPPAAGELHEALTVLAAKTWRHPFTGLDVRFGVSTLERWYYAAKKAADPVQALRNQVRHDIGRFPSLSAEAVQALTTQYRAHPGWTAQLHHDNLRVTLAAAGSKCPSYPSVRRYLKAQGLLRRAPAEARRATAPSPPAIGSNNARCAATKSSTSCSSCISTSITARARC